MLIIASAFLSSFLLVMLIVRFSHLHGTLSLDHDLTGIQKIHRVAVPRIGGAGVVGAFAIALLTSGWMANLGEVDGWRLFACSLPVFASGIIEDLTKRISPAVRLACSFASAALAVWCFEAVIGRAGVPLIDGLLLFVPVAIGVTVLAVAGLVHAVNIIDGLNGLASTVSIFMLGSIGVVAYRIGDVGIVSVTLALIGATGGFLLWNFPNSKIFLGDGGAYFIGFFIAELLILLIARNPDVSPLYAVLVAIYPLFEMMFSIYRRRVLRGLPAAQPDAIHLHTLIFRRVTMKRCDPENGRAWGCRNSRTSPYLWLMTLAAVVPATMFPNRPVVLAVLIGAFCVGYIWIYFAIARFRTPFWMKSRHQLVHARKRVL